jgi:hydroxyacylglutathione hydrolase
VTSGKFVTTVGYEKRFNPALTIDDRERFIEFMTIGQPSRPANCEAIVAINQGRRPLATEDPAPAPLSPERVADLTKSGTVVVDTRGASAFGAGHIPGAINVQLGSREFEQRVGWVVPGKTGFVLVTDTDEAAPAAARRLAFVGLDGDAVGFLAGGMTAWMRAGRAQAQLAQTTVHDLDRDRLDPDREAGRIQILDVREDDEWAAGQIPGATHLSYRRFRDELEGLELDRSRPTAVVCAGGVRSSIAASLLVRAGYEAVRNVVGGMGAWRAGGLPLAGPGQSGV